MSKTAVFPGSFDPITRGHESIVLRALPLFDRVVVAIGDNQAKQAYFPLEQRLAWLKEVFSPFPPVVIDLYRGLTVDYCRKIGAGYLIRGLRSSVDFEYENSLSQINKQLYPDLETIFIAALPEFRALQSCWVRDIIRHGGDASPFVPKQVKF